MSIPTTRAIRAHLASQGVRGKRLTDWSQFLAGLDWAIIKPLASMALHAGTHPALAAGLTARSTGDDHIRAALLGHLETKAGRDNRGTPSDGAPADTGPLPE